MSGGLVGDLGSMTWMGVNWGSIWFGKHWMKKHEDGIPGS